MRLPLAAALSLSAAACLSTLTGCSVGTSAPPSLEPGVALSGSVHGGQQPVVGAHVYLMAANTTGYGAPSLSLLTPLTLNSDSVGNYVLTGNDGSFTITGDYTCTPGSQVYLDVQGGNPGAGLNSAASFMAVVGNCPLAGIFSPTTFIWVNEVSTIAAAYAMAGFAVDETHVASSGSALAQTGIANAFANAASIANPATGVALALTPAGGTISRQKINTLANILASCVNSNGPSSSACSTLLATARSAGTSGIPASTTANAAINIAHNPGVNIATLFNIPPPTVAFAPALTNAPNDFGMPVSLPIASISSTGGLAIDALGNAWVVSTGSAPAANNNIIEYSSTGSVLSGANGYLVGTLSFAQGIAIDLTGNAWVANSFDQNLIKFAASNGVVTSTSAYTGGNLSFPTGIGIDGAGNAWTSSTGNSAVVKFSNSGALLSGINGYTGGGLANGPVAVALDAAGNAWVSDYGASTKLDPNGNALSPASGFSGGAQASNAPNSVAIDNAGNAWLTTESQNFLIKLSPTGAVLSGKNGITGGGMFYPGAVAIDGAGNVWVGNEHGQRISEFSNDGVPITNAGGLQGFSIPATGIAVDGSGDVWVAATSQVTEFIGAAVPVVTPIAAGVKNNTLGTRP